MGLTGTKLSEIKVQIEPNHLTVKLGWFGRVVDGPLHRRCKSSESLWVLEDNELHIVLTKDDPHCWKGLFEGGSEKGYMEVSYRINFFLCREHFHHLATKNPKHRTCERMNSPNQKP